MIAFAAGHTMVRAQDEARERPVLIDLWYPAGAGQAEDDHDYGLGRGRVAESAHPADARCPVIALSHGAYGAASNYAWIAEHLARRGYLVMGVSHFGESYAYGPATIDPAAATRPWDRPVDVSFALDHVLSGTPFGERADQRRTGALGHSSGGATVLQLGGAIYDPAAMQRYCASDAALTDRGCDYGRGADPAAPAGQETRSYRDPRVKAIVALDPALGPGHRAASLAAITVPVHIVGAVDNDFLPFESHAARYARQIPGASLTRLTGGEGHFVYLDVCDAELDANGVPLCRDRRGVDRALVHARLAGLITAFFEQHLAPA